MGLQPNRPMRGKYATVGVDRPRDTPGRGSCSPERHRRRQHATTPERREPEAAASWSDLKLIEAVTGSLDARGPLAGASASFSFPLPPPASDRQSVASRTSVPFPVSRDAGVSHEDGGLPPPPRPQRESDRRHFLLPGREAAGCRPVCRRRHETTA